MGSKKYVFTVCLIVTTLFSSCKSQNRTVEESSNTPKEWFGYNMYGDKNSMTIYTDKMVFKSPWDTKSAKAIDTIYIQRNKELPKNHVMIQNQRKKEPFGILKMMESADGKKIALIPLVSGMNADEVLQKFKVETLPSWIDLTKQTLYSAEMIEKVDAFPGLDEVTAKDMLTALQWREPLGIKLQAFLEDTKGARSHMIYRFVDQYRNERLVELGYNPFKQVIYNFEEQFKDDPEVLKLLKEEIKF